MVVGIAVLALLGPRPEGESPATPPSREAGETNGTAAPAEPPPAGYREPAPEPARGRTERRRREPAPDRPAGPVPRVARLHSQTP